MGFAARSKHYFKEFASHGAVVGLSSWYDKPDQSGRVGMRVSLWWGDYNGWGAGIRSRQLLTSFENTRAWFAVDEPFPCYMRGSLAVVSHRKYHSGRQSYSLARVRWCAGWMDHVLRRFFLRFQVTCVSSEEWEQLLKRFHNRIERFWQKHGAQRGQWAHTPNLHGLVRNGPHGNQVLLGGEVIHVEPDQMETIRQLAKLHAALA